jgi:hypothetical protein
MAKIIIFRKGSWNVRSKRKLKTFMKYLIFIAIVFLAVRQLISSER